MKRIILGVAAALFVSAGQAAADGLPSRSHVKAPESAVAPNWNGFYIGLGVGAGSVTHDVGLNVGRECHGECEGTREVLGLDGIGGQGFFGTVSVGYDRQIHGRWVVGVFADYDFGSSVSTEAHAGPFSASIDQNYTWAIGARLGVLVNPTTLFYGTAGYTETEFEATASGFGQSASASQTFSGYFVGTGLETMLRDNWSLKLEYRYSQFDEVKFGEECFNLTVEPVEHSARLVLSYKFGHRD